MQRLHRHHKVIVLTLFALYLSLSLSLAIQLYPFSTPPNPYYNTPPQSSSHPNQHALIMIPRRELNVSIALAVLLSLFVTVAAFARTTLGGNVADAASDCCTDGEYHAAEDPAFMKPEKLDMPEGEEAGSEVLDAQDHGKDG